MLTEHDIESKALEFVAGGEAPLWGGGFVQGANWANEQNGKELARLRVKVEILQGAYDTAKDHAAHLEKENAELARKIAMLKSEKLLLATDNEGLRDALAIAQH